MTLLLTGRTGKNGWHGIHRLVLRTLQSVYEVVSPKVARADVNDGRTGLGRDPAMRWIVGGRAENETRRRIDRGQMGDRFETELLAGPMTTSPRSLTFWASGSTRLTSASRRRLSCSTWTAPSARPIVITSWATEAGRRQPSCTVCLAPPSNEHCWFNVLTDEESMRVMERSRVKK